MSITPPSVRPLYTPMPISQRGVVVTLAGVREYVLHRFVPHVRREDRGRVSPGTTYALLVTSDGRAFVGVARVHPNEIYRFDFRQLRTEGRKKAVGRAKGAIGRGFPHYPVPEDVRDDLRALDQWAVNLLKKIHSGEVSPR